MLELTRFTTNFVDFIYFSSWQEQMFPSKIKRHKIKWWWRNINQEHRKQAEHIFTDKMAILKKTFLKIPNLLAMVTKTVNEP